MKNLWAPWRKAYITGKAKTPGCFLCRDLKAPQKKDKGNYLLFRSQTAFIVLNRFPYTNGHLMVVPNRHVSSLEKLNNKERLDLLKLVDLALSLLKKVFRPHGFNVGLNLGQMGGAGVPGHIHVHAVPRWKGDTNFMPVLTGTKVISESLQSTFLELKKALQKNK